mmetsp:Transcript_20657/g.29809  ORF Transcript_20657/g.29809 Transcript_20657/m.29809 type:complete len:159 (-) Transcript_20657:8-484(-)
MRTLQNPLVMHSISHFVQNEFSFFLCVLIPLYILRSRATSPEYSSVWSHLYRCSDRPYGDQYSGVGGIDGSLAEEIELGIGILIDRNDFQLAVCSLEIPRAARYGQRSTKHIEDFPCRIECDGITADAVRNGERKVAIAVPNNGTVDTHYLCGLESHK